MSHVRTPGDVLADGARLEELEAERAALLAIHRPRRYGRGAYSARPEGRTVVRCIACAENGPNGLRRADWPCATARTLGVES